MKAYTRLPFCCVVLTAREHTSHSVYCQDCDWHLAVYCRHQICGIEPHLVIMHKACPLQQASLVGAFQLLGRRTLRRLSRPKASGGDPIGPLEALKLAVRRWPKYTSPRPPCCLSALGTMLTARLHGHSVNEREYSSFKTTKIMRRLGKTSWRMRRLSGIPPVSSHPRTYMPKLCADSCT